MARKRTTKRSARRKAATNQAAPASWLVDWVRGGEESASGVSVTAASAQRCATVFACVQVLSQDIAKLPLILYSRDKGGRNRERATNHPLFDLMAVQPNRRQTSFEWREMVQGHLALTGNAYNLIVRDGRGRPTALWPLMPHDVKIKEADDRSLFYEFTRAGSRERVTAPGSEILHLRERSEDGIVGKSRIAQARDSIGLAIATERHGARLFGNGARPGGVLIHKGRLDKAGRERVLAEWDEKFGGVEKAHRTAVLAEGMEYKPVAMTSEDAQFLETRKFQRAEIAALFRIPPHKIGDLERATFSNIEHQALEYVIDTLLPICRRWEQALNVALLTEEERKTHYFEFLLEGLLRGDFKSRMEGYQVLRNIGAISADEIRERENMNEIGGKAGAEYWRPVNMTLAGEPPPGNTQGADNAAPTPNPDR